MESYSPSQPLFGVTPMIVSESQNNDKAILVADDESPAPPDGPSNPPPYTSASSAGSPSGSAIRSVTQPRCNYLLDHRSNGNLRGTWHVDTSLPIPESLLPPIIDFDGRWNEETQKARKHKTPSISEVRPNLMVMTENGDVKADVYLMSGPAMVVAESKYGSVQLVVNAAPETVSRIHANASHGSVKVWIPSTFEGALTMGTTYGDIKISDGVRARMTTFYSKSNRSRSFIGDWQSAKFGTIQSEDGSKSSTPPDPFTSWPGSTIRIDSKNGTVSLAFIEEKPAANPASNEQNVFKTFFEGWFGKSVSTSEGTPSQAGTSQSQVGPSRDPVLEAALLDRKQLPPPPPGA